MQDEEFYINTIHSKILDGLETLYHYYVLSDNPKKLARIWTEDTNAFQAFSVLYLRHTVGVMT